MVTKIFSIFDTKAGVFSRPFQMTTIAEAIRAFSDLANDSQTSISKHPGDYQLVHIATFDDNTGLYQNAEKQYLGYASEFATGRQQPTISGVN